MFLFASNDVGNSKTGEHVWASPSQARTVTAFFWRSMQDSEDTWASLAAAPPFPKTVPASKLW